MLGYEEKLERIKLIDAVGDAGRLARGLDQLDPLDVEGILALRSISERYAKRLRDASRIPEAQNEVFYAEGKSRFSAPPAERERSALGGEAVALLAPPLRFRQAPGIGATLISLAR